MYVQQYQRFCIACLERSCQAWSLSCDNFFLIVKIDQAKNCQTLTRWPLVWSSETACKNLSGGKICQVASTATIFAVFMAPFLVLYFGVDVGVLLSWDGNCPQILRYVNTKKYLAKKHGNPSCWYFVPKFWGQKMNPIHCKILYYVPKTPIKYYLWGFGTLFVLCHGEYTCSHVTFWGLYRPRSTNSNVAFWNPRNYLISKDHKKNISRKWSIWLTPWWMVSHYLLLVEVVMITLSPNKQWH